MLIKKLKTSACCSWKAINNSLQSGFDFQSWYNNMVTYVRGALFQILEWDWAPKERKYCPVFWKTKVLHMNFFFVWIFECYFVYFFIHRFLVDTHFIHISVHMSIPISQFILPPPPPPLRRSPCLVSISLFFTSVSQFLPCKLLHLYHFSSFHIYAFGNFSSFTAPSHRWDRKSVV